MNCPNCNHSQSDESQECHRCGIIFTKWKKIQERQFEQKSADAPAQKTPVYQWAWAFIGAGVLGLAIFQATRPSQPDDEPPAINQSPAPATFRSDESSQANTHGGPQSLAVKTTIQELFKLLDQAQNDSSNLCGREPLTRPQIKKDPSKETILRQWQDWTKQWIFNIEKIEKLLPDDSTDLQTHVRAAREKLLTLTLQMKKIPNADSAVPPDHSTPITSVPADWMVKIWLTNGRQLLNESLALIEPE